MEIKNELSVCVSLLYSTLAPYLDFLNNQDHGAILSFSVLFIDYAQ